MHPMFVTLFIETDADELLTEAQDRKRHAFAASAPDQPGSSGSPPRSCVSSSSENTSLVAIGVPSPEERTSLENTYPTWTLTRSKTEQPALSLCGRDANRCFCAGWCR